MATGIRNAQAVKASILKLLRAIKSRSASYSFRLVQAHLREHDMPSASGWAPLMAKYESLNYEAIPTLREEYVEALQELLHRAIRCGTSVVWFFEAQTEILTALTDILPGLVDTTSNYHQSFPFTLESDELLAQSMAPVCTKFETFGDGDEHILFMCSKRAFREREPLIINDLIDQVRDALIGYDEVIGVRSGFTQAFDRLIVRPQAGYLELHIDLCCPLNTEELAQFCISYIARLKEAAHAYCGDHLPWLGDAKNLFPRIAELYNTRDGRVLSLGHATGTKSIKEERMRGRALDLRDELFHKHGIQAIHGTDAYSIKKGWQSATGAHVPSIAIFGHFSSAGAAHAAVRYAIIESCSSPIDVDLVRSKLLA